MSSRIIPKEQLTAYQRWELLGFDESTPSSAEGGAAAEDPVTVNLPTAEELERIHQQAAQEGFKIGHEEGYKAGYEMGRQAAAGDAERLAALIQDIDGELLKQDDKLAREVLDLALAVAKQMLRSSLKVKEGLVLEVIREALNSLPALASHMRIVVHPDDLRLVSEFLSSEQAHFTARAVPDPRIERGGFKIESSHSELDGELAVRWQEIIDCLGTDTGWLG